MYQNTHLLPLFGVKTREVAKSRTDEGNEMVWLGNEGFEKNLSKFWLCFEWTIGWLLAEYIKSKSLKIVLEDLKQRGETISDNGREMDQKLTKARYAFGSKRIAKLFQLKTRGFNYSSPLMQHFCKYVAQAEALDDVYNALGSFSLNGKRVYPKSASPDLWSRFYLGCPNAQAVRNRYRLVARLYEQFGSGRTLSIACGSAQSLIHTTHALKENGSDRGIKLFLTDISEDSLALAYGRAIEAGIEDQVSCHRISFLGLLKKFAGEKFDIIEACGILDYLSDDNAVTLLKFALRSLDDNGKIIVSNMNKTRGANLLRKMYNWEINYRSPEELSQLINRAGGKEVKVYIEPWEIHPVAIASYDNNH